MGQHFAWKDEYALGNDLIDGQHRRFFDLANRLIDTAGLDDATPEILEEHVMALANYAYFHLATEERHLLLPECGNGAKHVAVHNSFREEVMRRIAQIRGTVHDRRRFAREIAEYAGSWLSTHILVMDKGYAACLSLMIPGDPSFPDRAEPENPSKPPDG
ncbi:hypothetical protein EPO34_01690 [Patescibacteria group bacterium]|nr:MAG: hypothetical protein EPO34_01690 [Patescibacteria group bacterium]